MKTILTSFFMFCAISLMSQNSDLSSTNGSVDQTVTVTSTGIGLSSAEAKKSALRDALEQAFGAFITSSTQIINDEIIEDEINSIAFGNILSYDVLSETMAGDKQWMVVVRADVSVNKLLNLARSEGMEVSFDGDLFALNIKQKILNAQGEIKAIENMVQVLNEVAKSSFNYSIETGEPYSKDGQQLNWSVPLTISVRVNENFKQIPQLMIQALSGLSLKDKDLEDLKARKVDYYIVNIMRPTRPNNEFEHFYLRNAESRDLIAKFVMEFKSHLLDFTVNDGIQERRLDEMTRPYKGYQLEDNFRVATFLNFDIFGTPSLFKATAKWKMYLPYTAVPNRYDEVDCNCMGNLQSNKGGFVLQFNKVADKDNRALLIKLTDDKSLDELSQTKTYTIKPKNK